MGAKMAATCLQLLIVLFLSLYYLVSLSLVSDCLVYSYAGKQCYQLQRVPVIVLPLNVGMKHAVQLTVILRTRVVYALIADEARSAESAISHIRRE